MVEKNRFFSCAHRKTLILILVSSLVSILIMTAVFPDLLFFHKKSAMSQHDTGIPFENAFTLITFFYHGGIQLWDRYDQMGFAYTHLSSGLYTLVNILIAGIYIILSPFIKYPGEAFVSIFTILYYGLTTLIRCIGGYLLIKRFCRNPVIIFLTLVHFNTLLSCIIYHGFSVSNLYSYLPLLMYFILRLFEKFQLNDFLGAMMVMSICVANSPLLALGYFYLAVHFFIISCIIYTLVIRRKRNFSGLIQALKKGWTRKNQIKILAVLILCLFIILPSVLWFPSLRDDFHIHKSGLGGTEGRLKNIFNVSAYFDTTSTIKTLANPKEFVFRSLNFWKSMASFTWVYMGATTLLLSGFALIFSKEKKKHIIFWTIFLIYLANCPLEKLSPASLAHWINVLTNPFAFLLRSFHMTALLMPFVFPPLIALGLDAGWKLSKNESEDVHHERVPLGFFISLVIMIALAFHLEDKTRLYGVSATLLPVCYLYILWEKNHLKGSRIQKVWDKFHKPVLISTLLLIFIVDLVGLSIYLNTAAYIEQDIVPEKFTGLETQRPLVLHYQNPKIMPFQDHVRANLNAIMPQIFTFTNYYGLYYHHTPMERFFINPDIYHPRHVAYGKLYADEVGKRYITDNPQLISFADYAIHVTRVNQSELLEKNLGRQIIMLHASQPRQPRMIAQIPDNNAVTFSEPEKSQIVAATLPLEKAKVRNRGLYQEYILDLPKEFPSYWATDVFTREYLTWSASIGEYNLSAVQGKLNAPFNFDVQNVHEGKISILLPHMFDATGQIVTLKKLKYERLQKIWRNEHDNLGFTYLAPDDGWLVIHYPFDKKWQLTIDKKPAEIFRVNKYYIGTPLTQGRHKVLLQYWPNTRLRELIALSMVLTVLAFGGITVWGIRTESRNGNG